MTDLTTRLAARLLSDLEMPFLSPSKVEKAVRGMLEEVREPDEAMLEAGGEEILPIEMVGRARPDRFGARGVYRAMIDAALSPQEVEG